MKENVSGCFFLNTVYNNEFSYIFSEHRIIPRLYNSVRLNSAFHVNERLVAVICCTWTGNVKSGCMFCWVVS